MIIDSFYECFHLKRTRKNIYVELGRSEINEENISTILIVCFVMLI